ncbi:MAG TPA: hypothetical protein VGH74_09085 [Planctomycetaceae bacterium]
MTCVRDAKFTINVYEMTWQERRLSCRNGITLKALCSGAQGCPTKEGYPGSAGMRQVEP